MKRTTKETVEVIDKQFVRHERMIIYLKLYTYEDYDHEEFLKINFAHSNSEDQISDTDINIFGVNELLLLELSDAFKEMASKYKDYKYNPNETIETEITTTKEI